MSTRESRLAYVAWITICIVWGTTFLAIRVALESLPVALLAGFRWMAAGLVLTLLLPLFRGEVLPPRRSWPAIALVGFLMSVLGNGLVVWAEQYVASGLTAVVVGMVPFWSVAVEALSPGGERFTRRTLAGLVAGLAGIVVLVWPELTVGGQAGRMFVAGILALQIASLGWAIGTSYTKRHSLGTPLASSALQMNIQRDDVNRDRNTLRRVERRDVHGAHAHGDGLPESGWNRSWDTPLICSPF